MTVSKATKLVVPIDGKGDIVERAMGLPIIQKNLYLGSSTAWTIMLDLSDAKHVSRVFTGMSLVNPHASSSITLSSIREIGDVPYEFLECGPQQFWTLDNLMYGPGVIDESEDRRSRYILAKLNLAQGTQATATIDYTGQPLDGETLELNGIIYEFSSDKSKNPTSSDYIVEIGVNEDATYTNLELTLNLTQLYATAVINTGIDQIVLTASAGGTSGNSVTLSTAASNVTVSSATLIGGLGGVLPLFHIW